MSPTTAQSMCPRNGPGGMRNCWASGTRLLPTSSSQLRDRKDDQPKCRDNFTSAISQLNSNQASPSPSEMSECCSGQMVRLPCSARALIDFYRFQELTPSY